MLNLRNNQDRITDTEIKIRKAEEKDFLQILELFKEFALFENLPWRMNNSLERMIKEKEYFNCFVAESSDNRIIGYATWFFSYYTWVGKCMYMDDLYVKEEYRSIGIGKKLIDRVIETAKISGCHKLRWQVSNWNKNAQEFYKNLGATIDDIERNCDLILETL